MITATITNVVYEDNRVRVFWSFSSGKQDMSMLFDLSATKKQILEAIKPTVNELNEAVKLSESLKSIIGTVID